MTPYCSVALFRRDGAIVFKPPRKERPDSATQARKSAARHWSANLSSGDTLIKIVVLREFGGELEIAERTPSERAWTEYQSDMTSAASEAHLAACMAELGINPRKAQQPLPDTIEINGISYRREA